MSSGLLEGYSQVSFIRVAANLQDRGPPGLSLPIPALVAQ